MRTKVLLSVVIGSALLVIIAACSSGSKEAIPPKCPFETTEVNDTTVDIGYPEPSYWIGADTRVYLAARKYSKPEIRQCIESALAATLDGAYREYQGKIGATGEKLDFVWVGVFKKKSSNEWDMIINTRDGDNCIAAAEWRSPAFLSHPEAPERTARGWDNAVEEWANQGVVVYWNNGYFE